MTDWSAIQQRNLAEEYAPQEPRPAWSDPDDITTNMKQREYFYPQGDFLRDGFAPAGSTTTDFTIIRHEGRYHLFGVAGYGDCHTNWPGQYDHVFHASTANFTDWQVHGKALQPHPDHPYESGKIWPPFVFQAEGRFHMIYCGLDTDNCQCLCQAVSNDLVTWQRGENNPIVGAETLNWIFRRPDGRLRHCRDPHVEKIGDAYYLYYSTLAADANPAVGLAISTNLHTWHDAGPCLKSKKPGGWILESALVFERDGRYGMLVLPNNEVLFSDDPTNFHHAEILPVRCAVSFIAPEIIDRSRDDVWLVAFYGHKGRRISLGTMTWEDTHVTVQPISTAEDLAPFL